MIMAYLREASRIRPGQFLAQGGDDFKALNVLNEEAMT